MRIIIPALIFLAVPVAYADEIRCPPDIDVAVQTLAKPVADWSAFTDTVNTRYALQDVSVYEGDPSQKADLVPDEDNPDYAQWTLNDNGTQHYTLACRYSNTSVQLTRVLPPAVTTCRVTFATDMSISGQPSPQEASCD